MLYSYRNISPDTHVVIPNYISLYSEFIKMLYEITVTQCIDAVLCMLVAYRAAVNAGQFKEVPDGFFRHFFLRILM
jgi:hypothetical protein